MQYELRTQVIEPPRKTFTHLVARYGDRPASRYEEGTIDIQAEGELPLPAAVGPRPRDLRRDLQRLPAHRPLLVHRPAAVLLRPLRHLPGRDGGQSVASTLDYLESHGLLARLPEAWSARHGRAPRAAAALRVGRADGVLRHRPLRVRHDDHPVRRLCRLRPDRQRPGASAGSASRSAGAPPPCSETPRPGWVEDAALQGLRRLMEELFLEKDWGRGLIRLDVTDRLLYGAVLHPPRRRGHRRRRAGSYSLVRPAPLLLVHGPAEVGRRPLQGLGRRPRDRGRQQGAARRHHGPGARAGPGRPATGRRPRRGARRHRGVRASLEATATTLRDAVAALTA